MIRKDLSPIPIGKLPKYQDVQTIIVNSIGNDEKLVFSFQLLDFSNPYFNCNGMCDKGIKNCFEKLREYSKFTINEIFSGKGSKTLRFHEINKEHVKDWPDFLNNKEQIEDSFKQISFGKTKGRAHGLLIGNVFYIIWLDPHHYLYHDKKFGPKKVFSDVDDCCSYRNDILEQKNLEINQLKLKIAELEQMIDDYTNPKHSQ